MAFSSIDYLALVIIVISAVKILVILVKPQIWANLVKKIWAKPMVMSVICLFLAAGTLYLLIQSGLTIVQILAVTLFAALLAAVGVGIYAKETVSLATKMLKKGILKRAWLYTLIWVALIAWGTYELFLA